MKTWITIALTGAGALCMMFFFAACSSKATSNSDAGVCGIGYVSTSYGCLPQGNCPYGQGYLATSNTCVAGTVGGTYLAWSGYSTGMINYYTYNDFLFRITGCTDSWIIGTMCSSYSQNMTVVLQTASSAVPTQAALGVIIGNYQAQVVIQGTVSSINSGAGVEFRGSYGTMQISLRFPSQTLSATGMSGYISENGSDFAGITVNRAY